MIEGAKSVRELLASDFEVVKVIATEPFLSGLKGPVRGEVVEVAENALAGLGEFQTNRTALAIARLKPNFPVAVGSSEFALALDDIRDPGNLGTIIRTADWYGIHKIIVSPETADFYNPKVINATMGSFTRVQVYYTDLATYFSGTALPLYGALLEGDDVHKVQFNSGGIILIGSESHGISPELIHWITQKITIPRKGNAESLNAAVATGILLSHLVGEQLRGVENS